MAQLLIKKSSWWEFNAKQAMIWVPVAAVQASTLAGLGYFYHRLNALEEQPVRQPPLALANTLQDVKAPVVRLSRIPPPPPPIPAPAPTALQVAMDSPMAQGFMQVGQDFSAIPTVATAAVLKAVPKPVSQSDGTIAHHSHVDRVVQANRANLTPKLKQVSPPPATPIITAKPIEWSSETSTELTPPVVQPASELSVADAEVLPVAIPAEVPRGKPLPVGIVAWVYLGELRDYGWYGQRLHIAPDSGLPEIGGEYRTQKIHGIYDQPYGNRTMGGFQQGDVVSILDVRHEPNHGVWAKVRKVHAVGR